MNNVLINILDTIQETLIDGDSDIRTYRTADLNNIMLKAKLQELLMLRHICLIIQSQHP